MNWWVYKCNSRNEDYQNSYGDWHDVFDEATSFEWGNSEYIPQLSKLEKGDKIIAYQTDKNEFVGLAEVVKSCGKNGELRLKVVEKVGRKMRELKRQNALVADIQAFKAGPIRTIYEISENEVRQLLKTAKVKYDPGQKDIESVIVAPSVLEPPKRIKSEITRIVRDTVKTKKLKGDYEYRCQLCDQRIEIHPKKFYCEVHHIKPLGGKHQGLDTEENMLVVCPTHHACFDLGVAKFLSPLRVKIGKDVFDLTSNHKINNDNIEYHNQNIVRSSRSK